MRFDLWKTQANEDVGKTKSTKELVSYKIKRIEEKIHTDIMRFGSDGSRTYVLGGKLAFHCEIY